MKKIILLIITLCLAIGVWFFYSEIYTATVGSPDKVEFVVQEGEDATALAVRLEEEGIIRNAKLFRRYIIIKGIDRSVRQGEFEVEAPVTLARVADALTRPSNTERVITILPGWDLRDIAQYFETEGMFQAEEITEYLGLPAVNYKVVNIDAPELELDLKIFTGKPWYVSYEGYLAPDTYRIFKDASLESVIEKILNHRENQITDEMYADMERAGRSFYEVLTMASILEREVMSAGDKAKVADLFWRRYDLNWALQADSTVHYSVGKKGDLYTTPEDRDSLSPWNTYKYPGLPIGPISSPSLESIKAAIYPEENDSWYFITDMDGVVRYGRDLEEHNINVYKYLR